MEVDLREAAHDALHADHDLGLDDLAFFAAPSLAGRDLRVIEVTGGLVTRVATIVHPGQGLTPATPSAPVFFYTASEVPYGGLSNFASAPFLLDGLHFANAEQALMHAKAVFADDAGAQLRIILEPDPSRTERLGHQTMKLDVAAWTDRVPALAERILMAKFEAHPGLAALLLSTGDARLGEASPTDHV